MEGGWSAWGLSRAGAEGEKKRISEKGVDWAGELRPYRGQGGPFNLGLEALWCLSVVGLLRKPVDGILLRGTGLLRRLSQVRLWGAARMGRRWVSGVSSPLV